jgi:hypothetical protein
VSTVIVIALWNLDRRGDVVEGARSDEPFIEKSTEFIDPIGVDGRCV